MTSLPPVIKRRLQPTFGDALSIVRFSLTVYVQAHAVYRLLGVKNFLD